jgi:hypothetical protein
VRTDSFVGFRGAPDAQVMGALDAHLATHSAAAQSYHRGVGAGLIDEYQSRLVKQALFALPARPRPNARASAPPRTEFFLKLMARRLKNRHTTLRLPAIFRLRIAATISSSVMSRRSPITPSKNSACRSNGEVLPPLGFVSSKRCTQITTTLGLSSVTFGSLTPRRTALNLFNNSATQVNGIGLWHRSLPRKANQSRLPPNH